MRAIVIDPFNREIRVEDVNPQMFVVGPAAGGGFESGFLISRSGILFVHSSQAGQPAFELREQNIFFGCGLIAGIDRQGFPRSTGLSVDHVAGIVRFLEHFEDGLRYAS
ncbi:hypothetical protein [Afipia sp. GAS231]|uniref:hypothetical protein n=1 Tax=Afipia sp. GAS231 TaxID=1882747 RepID=UPI00087BF66A|nr:hypothetical protein [Afipia sp. GAS231]SDO48008.1 hypothetical protein SAMN05444050_4239 [Afipia sp. GAS231]